jgi:recombination protein RecA
MVAVKKESTGNMAKKKTTTAKSKSAKGKKSGTSAKVDPLLSGNAHLKTTLQQIEKQFGEGAIMPLGTDQRHKIEGINTGSLSLDMALGGQGAPRVGSLKSMAPNPVVKQHWLYTSQLKLKNLKASRRLLMQNMLLIRVGAKSWE